MADKSITVISVNDSIEIKANQKIVLQAGQSSITLEGGDITFACPGNFTVKGGKHVFEGGASNAAVLPDQPTLLSTFQKVPAEVSGPHEITIMGFSAEGVALMDAVVTFYDKTKNEVIAKRTLSDSGTAPVLTASKSQDYRALIGYEGWSGEFEELGKHEDDDDFTFDPGVMDEDRDTEHL